MFPNYLSHYYKTETCLEVLAIKEQLTKNAVTFLDANHGYFEKQK